MSQITMNCLLIVSVILSSNLMQTIASDNVNCFASFFKYTIHTVNNLPPGSAPLVAHCQSKNDDFGNKTLAIGQDFNFSFCSIPRTTLYFCHFWWGNKNKAFDAYKAKWAEEPCAGHHCYWAAKDDGIYFSGYYPPEELIKAYNWE